MRPPTPAGRRTAEAGAETAGWGAVSAEAKAKFDVATLPNRIDNIRLDREKAEQSMQATDQTITINAPKVLAAMTEFNYWLTNPQLLDEQTRAGLENEYVKLTNETAWYKAHPGQTRETWSATQQILMAQASLNLRWQEYKNPIPTPLAPLRPGTEPPVSKKVKDAQARVANIQRLVAANKMNKDEAAKLIWSETALDVGERNRQIRIARGTEPQATGVFDFLIP